MTNPAEIIEIKRSEFRFFRRNSDPDVKHLIRKEVTIQ